MEFTYTYKGEEKTWDSLVDGPIPREDAELDALVDAVVKQDLQGDVYLFAKGNRKLMGTLFNYRVAELRDKVNAAYATGDHIGDTGYYPDWFAESVDSSRKDWIDMQVEDFYCTFKDEDVTVAVVEKFFGSSNYENYKAEMALYQ